MIDHIDYYNSLGAGYDRLHKDEQFNKLNIIKSSEIIKPSDLLLDVGCGTGFSLDFFKVKSSVGVDPAKNLLSVYSGSSKTICSSAENLPFEDSSFDVVISVTAIQNFTDVEKGLNEIKRVGKDRFALTFLKRLSNSDFLESTLRNVFKEFNIKKIEEERDFIFLIDRD